MYSFGVLLWELATGKRPWAGMMQMQARPALLPPVWLCRRAVELTCGVTRAQSLGAWPHLAEGEGSA